MTRDVAQQARLIFSIVIRALLSVVIFVGIGLASVFFGGIGGYSAGKAAIAIWKISSIPLLIWTVQPVLSIKSGSDSTNSSPEKNAKESNPRRE